MAEAAVAAGADLVNDVAGLTFDPALAPFCAARNLPVCVMHAQGDPATMQRDPQYENVLLDVYDYLAGRITALEAEGIGRQVRDEQDGHGSVAGSGGGAGAKRGRWSGAGCRDRWQCGNEHRTGALGY